MTTCACCKQPYHCPYHDDSEIDCERCLVPSEYTHHGPMVLCDECVIVAFHRHDRHGDCEWIDWAVDIGRVSLVRIMALRTTNLYLLRANAMDADVKVCLDELIEQYQFPCSSCHRPTECPRCGGCLDGCEFCTDRRHGHGPFCVTCRSRWLQLYP